MDTREVPAIGGPRMTEVETMRANLAAKYPAKNVAKKMAAAVAERAANGGDVSMFPKTMRRTLEKR